MGGFLTRLERKGKKNNAAEELIVAPRALPNSTEQETAKPGAKIVTTDVPVGSVDALFQELEAEGKKAKQQRAEPETNPKTTQHKLTQTKARTQVRIVQSKTTQTNTGNLSLDESMPWWLSRPATVSPQVDLLVPASRMALNELITDSVSQAELGEAIQRAVHIAATNLSSEARFSAKDIQEAIQELTSLMLGKGPLQPLYDDPAVTDIYLDRHDSIKCIRRGQALETPFRFRSPSECEAYMNSILQSVDRVLNLSSPIVDCVLNDPWRSRVNAVHSSVLDSSESSMVIRVPRLQQISFYDLLKTKTLPALVAAWIAELVSIGEANILVCGPTGSGKTTLTTALLTAVGSDERICTIEDVPEIFVPSAHLEKLVSRPENAQGEGSVGMDKLLRAALRRAPHRIVVGEIRDKEGPLFLKALETGHLGSVATIHAETPRDALWRLLDVVAAYEQAPQDSLQRRISRAVNIVISLKKINGRPCLTDISEVHTPLGGEFIVKQLLAFEGERDGKREWRMKTNHSVWMDKTAKRGVELAAGPSILPVESGVPTSSPLR